MSRPSCRATRFARANANSRTEGEGDRLDSARRKATAVLEQLRRTPMRRGALPRLRAHVRDEIARAIGTQSVPASLARRIAFQIAIKFGSDEWGDRAVWVALGQLL